MNKITLVLFALVLIIASGCSSGSDKKNLAGLEGRWAFNILVEDDNTPWKGTWVITSDQITKDGVALPWTYDGSFLEVEDNSFETIPDATCGDRRITKLTGMSMRLGPTDDYTNLSGTMDLTEISDSCDPVSATPHIFGNLLRIPEGNTDLTALAGTWDVELNLSGKLDGPFGIQIPLPIGNQIKTVWVITPTGIEDTGKLFSFQYDGSSLVVQFSGNYAFSDELCGRGTVFYPGMLSAALVGGSTSAHINGQIDMHYLSDVCGEQSGKITVDGTMTKRP